jgi:addiction module HigA family antidote
MGSVAGPVISAGAREAFDVEIANHHQEPARGDRLLIHPGEILTEEFPVPMSISPMSISQSRSARDINVPARRINEIFLGKRAVTPDSALRLARFFGNSAEFWMNLQKRYELERAKDDLQAKVDREVRPLPGRAA